MGYTVAQLLKYWATTRKVAVSIPDGFIEIFYWLNPSGCTVVLGSTQPLTEMCTRSISLGVKKTGVWSWQPCHLHVPIVYKFKEPLTLEALSACSGMQRDSFIYIYIYIYICVCVCLCVCVCVCVCVKFPIYVDLSYDMHVQLKHFSPN